MGLYVEVMCDRRLETGYWQQNPPYGYVRCFSQDNNNNPQGPTIAAARKAARKDGWLVESSGYCVCPYCRKQPVEAIDSFEATQP